MARIHRPTPRHRAAYAATLLAAAACAATAAPAGAQSRPRPAARPAVPPSAGPRPRPAGVAPPGVAPPVATSAPVPVPPPAAGRRDAEQPRPAASPARGRFAVAGGPAAPTGTLDDEADLGFGLTGSADVRPAGFPVALRAEASYHRFGADEDSFSNVRSGSVSMLGGQLNALAALGDAGTGGPAAGRYRLYALGGLGLYRAAASARLVDGSKDDESEFVLGFGFGGGVEFRAGTRRMFAEVRYQSIRTDNTSFAGDASNFIPIVLGVRF